MRWRHDNCSVITVCCWHVVRHCCVYTFKPVRYINLRPCWRLVFSIWGSQNNLGQLSQRRRVLPLRYLYSGYIHLLLIFWIQQNASTSKFWEENFYVFWGRTYFSNKRYVTKDGLYYILISRPLPIFILNLFAGFTYGFWEWKIVPDKQNIFVIWCIILVEWITI